ncbi:type II inositol 3,4-bisphosphate 4-phosphatase-like isoform X3 [Synchiropus splendidus]|uniref:type II inositol 3,4-bisphosphate 4-phosphatase-like isoform X3 n=1 Tax=Synchiropus splendidus TaxID=270530 RepID=UPI00237EB553|nr:type II inositol 3,4-bisphosphate 4-phosphatase-like isoform X3 [Synchiropus splendidus]
MSKGYRVTSFSNHKEHALKSQWTTRMRMKKKRMDCNDKHLTFLSSEPSGNFQIEGKLRVGRQQRALTHRFCRVRGNFLFILKKKGGTLDEVLLLERCKIMSLPESDTQLRLDFESQDPPLFLKFPTSAECASWLNVLRDANTEALSLRIAHLQALLRKNSPTHTLGHTCTAALGSQDGDGDGDGGTMRLQQIPPMLLKLECDGVDSASAPVEVQMECSRTFLVTLCCHGDCQLNYCSRIKISVSHKTEATTYPARSFLGLASFSFRDLFKTKDPQVSLSLRSMDGVNKVGELKVTRLHMEGEGVGKHAQEQEQSPALCDCLHSSIHDKENSPMMRAVLCSQVCKLYRFQTEDQRWLLVREQMSETPLSFSLPKQLLSNLIHELRSRIHEITELGDLPPHLDKLRQDVINHCDLLITSYQETLCELEKHFVSSSFKSSLSKSDRHLQFVPTNLHSQRMEVTCADSAGVWYDVITFGAPADHHHGFKHGGLKRLLNKQPKPSDSLICYTQEENSRARELLVSVAQLQPLIFGHAEELLSVSLEHNTSQLLQVLNVLVQQTEQFVHALKDELVKSALMAMHDQQHDCSVQSNGLCDNITADLEGVNPAGHWEAEYDEEEWDRVWANVAKSINCIVVMVDRIHDREDQPPVRMPSEHQEATEDSSSPNNPPSPSSASSAASWQELLLPLVVTLRDCVREAVTKAKAAMAFVVLQRAVAATVANGPSHLMHRRHTVFSQALPAAICGFLLKLYGGLEDSSFLQQLHTVGILVQFEGLLSTYGDELGMLEDMEVGVGDLGGVSFTITEAKTDQPKDMLPSLHGAWGSFVVDVPVPSEIFQGLPQKLKDGCLIQLHPVLFNIGINQQQSLAERFGDSSLQERVNQLSCERLKVYCNMLRDRLPETTDEHTLSDLLTSLDRSIESKKRKNVEVLWLACLVCRKVNGVRLTSCKSAKDRTAMSVTLEQCVLLREQHTLSQQHFSTALDSMRRSRLSWGQMLGCYPKSQATVSGFDLTEEPLTLQSSLVPECFAPKAPRQHLYPVVFLLVTSHLLVLWLILSLVIMLSRYQ